MSILSFLRYISQEVSSPAFRAELNSLVARKEKKIRGMTTKREIIKMSLFLSLQSENFFIGKFIQSLHSLTVIVVKIDYFTKKVYLFLFGNYSGTKQRIT
ncbi:MAG: hypothetical protein COZ68_00970 [Deltaproteobacteria bacterium CG_4_8_14_3_um_filter_43_13]|nr:MAG: hypothetical protein COZ68_00970 [Deltaproteobacteria bacterium CG_4_8_14_3_um_filter_43_13]